nr:arsenate reductase ArsC [Catenulispora pinisilvae]
MTGRPSVLFVCVHNAGRSQMAAGFLTHLAGDRVAVRSAGSAPAGSVNPAVVAAMAEVGIDLRAETPKVLTDEAALASDVIVTMGCGDACPVYPGKRYLDWELPGRALRRCGRFAMTSSGGCGGSSANCSGRSDRDSSGRSDSSGRRTRLGPQAIAL